MSKEPSHESQINRSTITIRIKKTDAAILDRILSVSSSANSRGDLVGMLLARYEHALKHDVRRVSGGEITIHS